MRFSPLDIIIEYWIEHVTFGLLYVMFTFPTMSQILFYSLHSTSVLSFYVDVVLTLTTYNFVSERKYIGWPYIGFMISRQVLCAISPTFPTLRNPITGLVITYFRNFPSLWNGSLVPTEQWSNVYMIFGWKLWAVRMLPHCHTSAGLTPRAIYCGY